MRWRRGRLSLEAVPHGDLVTRLEVEVLDVRGTGGVADVDLILAGLELERLHGGGGPARLAVHEDLAPGLHGEDDRRGRRDGSELLAADLGVAPRFVLRRFRGLGLFGGLRVLR